MSKSMYELINQQAITKVIKSCQLCGSKFTVGLENKEVICSKCREIWKEIIESKERIEKCQQ